MILRLVTRKSPLAWQQATLVKQQLQMHQPDMQIELVGLVTAGDKRTDVQLTQLGGKSLFVKELQTALLENQADFAVHSVKDMSVTQVADLTLTAVCKREDPRDAFVSARFSHWQNLPKGAEVGTASPRRQSQLLALRPDLSIKLLRGNVGSRLTKLDNSEFDAIILAAAGLKRLEFTHRITQYLEPEEFIPAIGQGALGIECRTGDSKLQTLLAPLNDWSTHQCVIAERAVNFKLGGDCYTPVGAFATIDGSQLTLHAMVGSLDGSLLLKTTVSGPATDAERLGTQAAEQLLTRGAKKLCS